MSDPKFKSIKNKNNKHTYKTSNTIHTFDIDLQVQESTMRIYNAMMMLLTTIGNFTNTDTMKIEDIMMNNTFPSPSSFNENNHYESCKQCQSPSKCSSCMIG